MRIFLETASVDEIRRGACLGAVNGVTTDRTPAARQGTVGLGVHPRAVQCRSTASGFAAASNVSTERTKVHQAFCFLVTQTMLAAPAIAANPLPAAPAGADISTASYTMLARMKEHPMTDVTASRSGEDWGGLVRV